MPEGQEAEARYRAPALDKGLDILELLSGQPGGLTRAEIVKAMGRSPGEVYRMLERLVARHYVGRSREGDRYALTMKLFSLAHRHPPLRRLVAPAQPLMDGFAVAAGQSCHLVVRDGDRGTVVAQASCPGSWEFGLRIGAPIDLRATGSGQLLLAFTDPEALAALRALWGRSPEDGRPEPTERSLAALRAAGHRIGPSGQVRGIEDISVPVLGPDGFALAVLTCPFIDRLDGPQAARAEALALLGEAAARLSLR
jgi:DNA-binding IclR family transcriptional regulator